MPPGPPTAATRTVLQTLELFDGPFAAFAASFGQGEYALWLGSAISRERVAALNGVLGRLIEFLRTRITAAADCPYRTSLNEILALANPSDEEKARMIFTDNSTTWPDLKIILRRLSEKYSLVLDIAVAGQPDADYLLWEAADFANTFANQEPDAEHLCIGILALEGAVSELVSANWDGLIEAAIRELGQNLNFYRICVTGTDFRGPAAAAKLLKFHGCAVRAIENEAFYRPLLIARWSQIVGWGENNTFAAMKHELVNVSVQRRTLMIGMSAQDPNIQSLFQKARELTAWSWNDNAPAHVFAEQELGPGQRTILQISYGNDFHPNQAAIVARSRIQAFGKPLLAALVLDLLARKCSALMRSASAPHMGPADFVELDRGIKRIRDLSAENAGTDTLAFIRTLVKHTSRVKAVLQEGSFDPASATPYRPISNRHQVDNDANLNATGQREAVGGLALLGLGERAGSWKLSLEELLGNEAGAIKVKSPAGEARVLFVNNNNSDLRLFNDGIYKEDDGDVIIIHSSPIIPPQQRNPSRPMGRKGKSSAVHVDVSELLREATNVVDLQERFRQGLGL